MSLTTEEKAQIDRIRQQYLNKSGLESFRKLTENISLAGISEENLRALVNPIFAIGVDYSTLPYATLDTDYMNSIAPGSIDVRKLKMKLANQSLLKGRITDIIDTQSGLIKVESEVRINADIDDYMTSRTISQGTNLQMINRAKSINAEKVANKDIKSVFVGVS